MEVGRQVAFALAAAGALDVYNTMDARIHAADIMRAAGFQ